MNIKSKDLEYPYNLVAEVFGDNQEEIIEKADTITDFAGSVEYVLCTLSERERKVLRHLYVEGLNLKDTGKIYDVTAERVRQIEVKAIRKLRHPNRAKYFEYGVTGVLEAIRTEYYNKFIDLEGKLIELCELNKITADKVINDVRLKQKYAPQNIEELDFSVRSYNCLKRAGIDTITQLAKLSYDELLNIRNLGRRSVAEIIEKLEKYGYDIRKNGGQNE